MRARNAWNILAQFVYESVLTYISVEYSSVCCLHVLIVPTLSQRVENILVSPVRMR